MTRHPLSSRTMTVSCNSKLCLGCYHIRHHPGAVVGLERTFFTVSENVGVVEICAVVLFPSISCPISFPFEVTLSLTPGTAGIKK